MRCISGMDINGWHDVAARNWDPDDPDQISSGPVMVDGSVGGVAVRQESQTWIGGPQAKLAPHGRGQGWGKLGDPGRRVPIISVCDGLVARTNGDDLHPYAVTVDSLARGSDSVVLAVPDRGEFDEAVQGRVLSLFRRSRRPHRLLWRPVALFLDALDEGFIPRSMEGALFRLLIHSSSGIDVQVLRLRADHAHPGHLAPERDGYGECIFPRLGLGRILQHADAKVLAANPSLRDGHVERSQLALELLCGKVVAGETEILRRDNGTWMAVTAPRLRPDDVVEGLPTDMPEDGSKEPIAASFFATPLAEPFASSLVSVLKESFPELQTLEWGATARGALRAGELIERGLPHYFDRLTPIGLAVMGRDHPLFEDLVGTNATLPANREYVSPVYEGLIWGRGKSEIDFYVLKGNSEVRHWQARQDYPPRRDVKVELRLRQIPGQSWAKLSLTSSEWEPLQRNPIFLDWDTINPVDAAPAEILARLMTPPPSIPERIVEHASLELWTGSERYAGLLPAIAEMRRTGRLQPDRIAGLLSRSPKDPHTMERVRPVGTDGELPDGLSWEDREDFLDLLATFAREIWPDGPGRRAVRDNERMKCLTWVFTLCPEAVQNAIVEALEADLVGRKHPFLTPAHARRVLTQGAGRAVAGVNRVRRVLTVLVARQTNNDTLSALSMILSRRPEAPSSLTADLVERIIALLGHELESLQSSAWFKARFKNALSALAGLFRYREVEAYALLSGRDPVAQRVRETLSRINALLDRHAASVPFLDQKREMIVSLQDHLDGRGDPNILRRIDDLDDE